MAELLAMGLWFSATAAAPELAESSCVGTTLTLQAAIGLLLTALPVQLVPAVAEAAGWRWAFASLAIGPALGMPSTLRLRGPPVATRLAGGRG